ncbi:MAG: hypothetical protein AAB932_04405 [Patescibacteria group bacterium]
MHILSIKTYALLCILGGEVAYTACLLYGTTLSGKAAELHHAMFELLPGFAWMSFGSWFAGAISIAIWSGIGGAFIAWMHNVSVKKI